MNTEDYQESLHEAFSRLADSRLMQSLCQALTTWVKESGCLTIDQDHDPSKYISSIAADILSESVTLSEEERNQLAEGSLVPETSLCSSKV